MVDKMGHLVESPQPTDTSMKRHKQMVGVAFVMLLKDQMGDFDPDAKDHNCDSFSSIETFECCIKQMMYNNSSE